MKTLPAEVLALLETGRLKTRVMLRFELDSGAEGIWSDTYPVSFEGITYHPVGGALMLSAIPGAVGLNADEMELAATGLSSDLNAILAGSEWHQRAAVVCRAYLDDDDTVLHVDPIFSGFMDAAPLAETGGGLATVTLRLESNSRELGRANGRRRADSDQRTVDTSDAFFGYVGAVAAQREIYWGRRGPQNPFKR